MDRVQTSAEQVLGYPDHLMKTCMEDYERRAHLEAMRLSGLKFMSVCSGIDAAGEALRLIQAAWKKADPGSPESWVTKTSFCDSGKEQQNFLVMLAELQELQTGCSPCVFTSIESRVPGDFCSEILQSPVPKSKAKARQSGGLTAADFEKLAKELEERPAEAFPRDARAHCLVHDQQCLVRPVRGGGAPSTLVETGASEDRPESFVMSAGGLPCVAWSKVGLRQAGGHISERAFQVWLAERRQWALDGCEDMFLFENVVEFPAREKIQDPLLETHHVIVLRLDPQDRPIAGGASCAVLTAVAKSFGRFCSLQQGSSTSLSRDTQLSSLSMDSPAKSPRPTEELRGGVLNPRTNEPPKPSARLQSQRDNQCFAVDCELERLRNQKWCAGHKRAYAALMAQAKKDGKLEVVKEIMADDQRCQICMREWCEKNPINERWSRKRLFDWSQFTERHGRRDYDGDHDGDVPMTEAEFLNWAQTVKRLTATGARHWWTEMKDGNVRRDHGGRDSEGKLGAERLWVPSAQEARERKKGRFGEISVAQGSKQIKNLDDESFNQLLDYAGSKSLDVDFVRGSNKSATDSGSGSVGAGPAGTGTSTVPAPAATSVPLSSTAAAPAAAEEKQESPKKPVDLALEKPKQETKLTKEMNSSKTSLCECARTAIETQGKLPETKDESLTTLVQHLNHRLYCFAALLNYPKDCTDQAMQAMIDGFTDQKVIADLLKGHADKLPVPEAMQKDLVSFDEVRTNIEALKNASTVLELDDIKEMFQRQKTALKTFEKGLAQVSRDCKSHVQQLEKEESRKQKAEEKKKGKAELDAFRESNTQRAKALLESKAGANIKPLYKACQFMFKKFLEDSVPEEYKNKVKPFPKYASGMDVSKLPWFAAGQEHQCLEAWSVDAGMQKTVQSWAIKYKQLQDYQQKSRASAALEPKHGHEQCNELWRHFVAESDILACDEMPSAATFGKTNWIAGYAPDMKFCGLQANGAQTLKAACLGDVLHVCMPLSTMLPAALKLGFIQDDKALTSTEAFCEIMEQQMEMKSFLEFFNQGVEVYFHCQKAGEMISLPMGWFSVEISTAGTILVSVRKGVFLKKTSSEAIKEYESLIQLLQRCSRTVDRYQDLLKLMWGEQILLEMLQDVSENSSFATLPMKSERNCSSQLGAILYDKPDLGFPCHRPRLYVLGFNKLRIAWQHAVSESQRFLQIFGSACGVRGDVYMLDSWTSRRADMEAKMSKRGVHLSSSSLASEPASRSDRMRVIQSSVCPSSKQHGLLYEVEFAKQAQPADPSKQVPFFSDWEQHPVKGSSVAGPTVPCLLTHGTLVEHSSGKLMTLNEIFAVQGWGTLPTSGYPSDILETIKSAKCQPHHARTFIGNSMHIPTAMAVLLYAFSHMQSTRSLNDRAFKLMRRASSWNLEHGAGSSPSVSVQPMLEDDCDDGRGKKRKAPVFRRQTSNFCDMD
ncbi:unnamed protein product [Symbiodinium sp. CCMP2456]|nr:unnamed protein product [Symbiodinium sp. CCMP2456]